MRQISVSVVIPTVGRIRQIYDCVNSILKQSLVPNEIIIIDSSKDGNLDSYLRTKFPVSRTEIKYIPFMASLTAARNMGVQKSKGDIVFFFDDDVILDKNYIKEVIKIFAEDESVEIGGVMGDVVNIKTNPRSLNEVLRGLVRKRFYLSYYGNGSFKPSGSATWVQGENRITKTKFLSGCMMAYRRRVLNKFKFDEELGKLSGYCFMEDIDFSYRVSRKYALVYTPYAKLEHHPSRSRKAEYDPVVRKRQKVFNHFYLFKKNMPKHFSNVFAFTVSLFGLLILTIFQKNPKEVVGWFEGIIDIISS
jgi:GT2 family glycosyltransferase